MHIRSTFQTATVALVLGLVAACSDQPTGPVEALDATGSAAASLAGPGAVYVTSNAATGNEILAFERASDGQLAPAVAYPTGGLGTGAGLGNQASLVLTRDHRYLYTVNAGSGDISTFAVERDGLRPIGDPVSSGGERPISLTVHGDLLYVLNAGGAGGIAGFRIGANGLPSAIAGSIRPLGSAAAGPAQIGFTPNGRALVVTEKATNTITTYAVGSDGRAGAPLTRASAGPTPFGFNFNQRGDLVVSEAAGGAAGASSASTYRVSADASLSLVSAAIATTQTAACWIAVSPNGSYAFTTNTGSGTVSRLAVGPGGALELDDPTAGISGAGSLPQDAAFTSGGGFLYVRNNGGSVGAFRVGNGGELTHIADFGPLPAGANGLAAR
ncbi:MAG: beta-propeller fold lactonase family protein [Gemmatimonadales bacterium]|jgi:DNA-binding beta-propeller fold protein YncE